MLQSFQLQEGFFLTLWPGTLPLGPAGGSSPRPSCRLALRTRYGAPNHWLLPPPMHATMRQTDSVTCVWKSCHKIHYRDKPPSRVRLSITTCPLRRHTIIKVETRRM